MEWVRINSDFLRNPKIRAAGEKGWRLYLASLLYCAAQETDGFIAEGSLGLIAAEAGVPPRLSKTLVDVDLWEQSEGGYVIPDYLELNPSRASLDERREQNRARMARLRGDVRGGVRAHNSHTVPQVSEQLPRSTRVDVTEREKPLLVPCHQGQADEKLEGDDDEIPEAAAGDRAESALYVLAQRDFKAAVKAGVPIKSPPRYQRTCLETRRSSDGQRVVALAAEHPDWDPERLADESGASPQAEIDDGPRPYTVCPDCREGFTGTHVCTGKPVRAERSAVEKSLAIGREKLHPTVPVPRAEKGRA